MNYTKLLVFSIAIVLFAACAKPIAQFQTPQQTYQAKTEIKFDNQSQKAEKKLLHLKRQEGISQENLIFIDNGLASKNDLIKVLGDGEIKTAIKITAHKFSKSAKAQIEKSGGEAIII